MARIWMPNLLKSKAEETCLIDTKEKQTKSQSLEQSNSMIALSLARIQRSILHKAQRDVRGWTLVGKSLEFDEDRNL